MCEGMFSLTAPLPSAVIAGGETYHICTGFRYGILLTELFAEDDADAIGKAGLGLRIFSPALYDAVQAGRVGAGEAFSALLWFYSCGRGQKGGRREKKEPVLDFSFDGERIYAAFRQVYGVDLREEDLHWWKFMALLRCLPPECELMRVVRLRMTDTAQIGDDAVRKQIRRAKAAVRIRTPGKEK